MRRWSKAVSIALVLVFGASTGYGWGSTTHVYFSKHLGAKFGPLNQNEMYGSVLLDMFGYDFANPSALAIDYALHTEKDILWTLHGAAGTAEGKALIYGCFTHTNSPDIKGADWYAHGVYPGDTKGWVIRQGIKFANIPSVTDYIVETVGLEHAEEFGVVVGHTLIETAVDILVKRYDDPLVGGRLYLAAKNRSDEISQLLAKLQDDFFPASEGYPDIVAQELQFREEMMQYGQLYLLPEAQLIPILSAQIAELAKGFIAAMYGMDRDISPEKVSEFIALAIRQVAPVYRRELLSTLIKVNLNMRRFAPPPAGPIFALFGSEPPDENLGVAVLPSETMPGTFALEQNFPNPFNPSTTIAYALPVDAQVTLKVYNSIGQEIAALVDGIETAGIHQKMWDAQSLPSGIYIYRLTAGGYAETRRMTLLK